MAKKKHDIPVNNPAIRHLREQFKDSVYDKLVELEQERIKENTRKLLEYMKPQLDVNLWQNLAVVIADSPLTESVLHALYEQNPYHYSEKRKELFPMYKAQYREVEGEQRILRALGIIADALDREDYAAVHQLLRKAQKTLVRTLESAPRRTISGFMFLQKQFQKDAEKNSSLISRIQVTYTSTVLWFFIYTGQIYLEDADYLFDYYTDDKGMEFDNVAKLFQLNAMSVCSPVGGNVERRLMHQEHHNSLSVEIAKGLSDIIYGRDKEIAVFEMLYRFFDNEVIDDENPDETFTIRWEVHALLELKNTNQHDAWLEGLKTCFILLEERCRERIHFEFISEYLLSKEEFTGILQRTFISNQLHFSAFVHLFTYELYLHVLLKDYHNSRSLLFEEKHLIYQHRGEELRNVQASMEKQLLEVKSDFEDFKATAVSKEKHQAAQEEIRVLERKVRELEKELAKKEEYTQEVHTLREYFFHANQEPAKTETITYEQMKEWLNGQNIVVVGGHNNWVTALKKELPNALYIDVDETGKDFSKIMQPNTSVFFNIAYNNHGNYYKVVKFMRGTNNPLHLINRGNIQLVLIEMYQRLNS